jgi:hypothetical protein
MTKNQTIELLQKQLPSFYSLEQVIDIVKGIDEGVPKLSSEGINELVSRIEDHVRSQVEDLSAGEVVDMHSAEFELNGNELSLESVDIEYSTIVDNATNNLDEVIEEFFGSLGK